MGADFEQSGRDRWGRSLRLDTHLRGCPPQQVHVARGFGGSSEQESVGVWRQCSKPLAEALFQPFRKWPRIRRRETTCKIGNCEFVGQFEDGEGITPRFGDDPVLHAGVETTRHHGR